MNKVSVFQKKYADNGLGTIIYRHSPKARRITIYINKDGRISVTIPRGGTFREAEAFLLSNQQQLIAKRNSIEQKKQKKLIEQHVHTKLHDFYLRPGAAFCLHRNNNTIELDYPAHLSIQNAEVQQLAQATLVQIYRIEAKKLLPARVMDLAQEHGFSHGKISIRDSRTRWGSCAANNNISLSLHLMLLPDHLIDYVILHELCHTVVKNHSEAFWSLLDSHCNGQAKALAKEMRQWTINM